MYSLPQASRIRFAIYSDHPRMIDLLRRSSRNVWNLTSIGDVDRLREVLSAEPRRAKTSWGSTPLFWLPEEEEKALEIAKLFLEHGADPNFRSWRDGWTAREVARKRGMLRVAALLDKAAGLAADPEKARREHLLTLYEQLARELVTVSEADDSEALDRLGRHSGQIVTFEMVRKGIGGQVDQLDVEKARDLIANHSGFGNWAGFLESIGAPARST